MRLNDTHQGSTIKLPVQLLTPQTLKLAAKRLFAQGDQHGCDPLALERLEGGDILSRYEISRDRWRSNNGQVSDDIRCEVYWAQEEELTTLYESLLKGWTPQRPIYLREPKKDGTERLMTQLSLTDGLVYQLIADHIAEKMAHIKDPQMTVNLSPPLRAEALMGIEIFGRDEIHYSLFENYFAHWQRFHSERIGRGDLKSECDQRSLQLDITSFYDSINHQVLFELLHDELGVDREIIEVLTMGLDQWQGSHERRLPNIGIPQGPVASTLLAQCYLRPLDREMMMISERGYRVFRYLDDICILTTTSEQYQAREIALRRGPLRELAACARSLGLSLNRSKLSCYNVINWGEAKPSESASTSLSEDEHMRLVEWTTSSLEESVFDLSPERAFSYCSMIQDHLTEQQRLNKVQGSDYDHMLQIETNKRAAYHREVYTSSQFLLLCDALERLIYCAERSPEISRSVGDALPRLKWEMTLLYKESGRESFEEALNLSIKRPWHDIHHSDHRSWGQGELRLGFKDLSDMADHTWSSQLNEPEAFSYSERYNIYEARYRGVLSYFAEPRHLSLISDALLIEVLLTVMEGEPSLVSKSLRLLSYMDQGTEVSSRLVELVKHHLDYEGVRCSIYQYLGKRDHGTDEAVKLLEQLCAIERYVCSQAGVRALTEFSERQSVSSEVLEGLLQH